MSRTKVSKRWSLRANLLVALGAAALLFATLMWIDGIRAAAQTGDTPTATPFEDGDFDVEGFAKQGKAAPKYGNMDSLLNELAEQVEQGISTVYDAAANAPVSDAESVAVTLRIEERHVESVKDFLEANGASPRNIGDDYIEAYVPVSLLGRASQQEGVISITTIIPPQPLQAGLVGEGVAAHGADVWQRAGFRGEGVKIGIIDVGFGNFRNLMGTDVPAAQNVHALCFTDIGVYTLDIADCSLDSSNPHGTVVTEAAFDIAPKATYYIANPASWGDLRTATQWMRFHEVNIINHSVGWSWSGPGDGTSPFQTSPLNTVNLAVDGGITWVNAAGNSGDGTWFGQFNDPEGDGIHNFQGSDVCNGVLLEADDTFAAQLRWDDAWGAPTKDLDLLLVNQATSEIVARSESFQATYPYPFEEFTFLPTEKGVYCLVVRRYAGQTPSWIQVQSFYGQILEHYTLYGSISTPAESDNPGLLAVGAAPWYDTTEIEYWSSRGPTPDGRIKPDIVGVDRVDTVTNGPTAGTSQAAPHVAGLAALVKQNFPELGPVGLATYLKGTAEDRGNQGLDHTWGYGFATLPATDAPFDPCFFNLWLLDEDERVEEQGMWDSSCVSERMAAQGGDRYARFYTFQLAEESNIAIELASADADAYLYLLEGAGKDGNVLAENDDAAPTVSTDSRIEQTLAAGEYTIEATTFNAEISGRFTLMIDVSGMDEPPPEPPEPQKSAAVEVSYGSDHACALRADGSVECYGSNEHGKATPPDGSYISVSSGEHGACAIRKEDGGLVCWGIFELNE